MGACCHQQWHIVAAYKTRGELDEFCCSYSSTVSLKSVCIHAKGAFLCNYSRIAMVLECHRFSHAPYPTDKHETPHLSSPSVFQRGRYGNKHRAQAVEFALFFLAVYEDLLMNFSSTFYFVVFNYTKEKHQLFFTLLYCVPLCTHNFVIQSKSRALEHNSLHPPSAL